MSILVKRRAKICTYKLYHAHSLISLNIDTKVKISAIQTTPYGSNNRTGYRQSSFSESTFVAYLNHSNGKKEEVIDA